MPSLMSKFSLTKIYIADVSCLVSLAKKIKMLI